MWPTKTALARRAAFWCDPHMPKKDASDPNRPPSCEPRLLSNQTLVVSTRKPRFEARPQRACPKAFLRGHQLELFDDVAWDTYCPVNRLGEFVGDTVTTCGLVVEQRTHHQVTGEPMKFLSLADWTGIVETELFAQTYKSYGLATVRYPVLEIEARVEPFENGRGYSLRALRAGKPRTRS
jgi:DNA polymerase III alpha subunit